MKVFDIQVVTSEGQNPNVIKMVSSIDEVVIDMRTGKEVIDVEEAAL